MFKFDHSIPFNRLKGKDVFWVCFSQSGCRIVFEDRNTISIFYLHDFCSVNNIKLSNANDILLSLIGSQISKIQIISNCKLSIEFTNSVSMNFVDLDGDFENYLFTIDDVDFVV